MTNPINQTSTSEDFTISRYIADGVVNASWGAVIGYLGSSLITVINPMGGLVFGATYHAVDALGSPLLDSFFDQSSVEKTANFILKNFLKLTVSMWMATQMGYAITFKASLVLIGTMFAIKIITLVALGTLGLIFLGHKELASAD